MITNYNELRAEEKRLREFLAVKKEHIRTDIREIKEEFKPALALTKIVSDLLIGSPSQNSIARTGANITVDLALRKVLSNSNFLVKLLVPGLVKNYTSHLVDRAIPFLKKIGGKVFAKKSKPQ
ncbi:MAG TPA: hypothetical protein VGK59_00350 [Ohtaekwangia sp.]